MSANRNGFAFVLFQLVGLRDLDADQAGLIRSAFAESLHACVRQKDGRRLDVVSGAAGSGGEFVLAIHGSIWAARTVAQRVEGWEMRGVTVRYGVGQDISEAERELGLETALAGGDF